LRGHYRAEPTHEQGISFLVVCFGETRLALPAEGVRGVLTSGEAGVGDAIRAVGIRIVTSILPAFFRSRRTSTPAIHASSYIRTVDPTQL